MTEASHRRYNPLLDEWVLVSPQRAQRPWLGAVDSNLAESRPMHDPDCYLCPGNVRANGAINPQYKSTYVFSNDFPSMTAWESGSLSSQSLFKSAPVRGECRVLCFSPRHDLTLAKMDKDQILEVVQVWCGQIEEMGEQYAWVQVFENKGEAMGSSNPHPHGQIWACDVLPTIPAKEDVVFRNNRGLLAKILDAEIKEGVRIVEMNDNWVFWVPFWASWPFEGMLAPREPCARLSDLSAAAREDLASIMRSFLRRYDRLFDTEFPYSMGWHGAPSLLADQSHWHLHAHYFPPLLRSASVKKFMVGFELLAEPQRDLTPEEAARRLREA
ncbi:MAG: UDP-glucose--hexose-1-phosphate uridylyltransferase [Chthonomonadaceae bacterium]|nr:UDP-glucose--hexose-1-phosphate uridylyltransferase [Chthonomonadaceae bacterium]